MAIHGARFVPRIRRPIRPIRPNFRIRKKPKVLYGVLRNITPPRRADLVYPYGVGGK